MKRTCLLILLALAGCATGPSLESRMAGYIGASSQTLVQQLGVPDKQITVDGNQYLAYDRSRTVVSPGLVTGGGFGPYFGGPFGGGFYGGPAFVTPPSVNVYSCETTFLLEKDHVVSFTLRGNDCAY
jgi:hypothetical protein